jgi:hypothetical protein
VWISGKNVGHHVADASGKPFWRFLVRADLRLQLRPPKMGVPFETGEAISE